MQLTTELTFLRPLVVFLFVFAVVVSDCVDNKNTVYCALCTVYCDKSLTDRLVQDCAHSARSSGAAGGTGAAGTGLRCVRHDSPHRRAKEEGTA
jgi:hypothetical protein